MCRELGYSTGAVSATRNSYFGQPSPHGLSSWFKCSGSEATLAECRKMSGGKFCPSTNAAGVRYGNSLKLLNGSGPHEGNLFCKGFPVCALTKGGSCGDWRDSKEKTPTVVCKMLGYTRATKSWCGTAHNSPFSKTTDRSSLSGVMCSASQASILDCYHELLNSEESHSHCRPGPQLGQWTAGLRCE